MSESRDKIQIEEAAALLKAMVILWNALPDEGKEKVRQEHPDVADAAQDVAKLVEEQEKGQAGEQGQKNDD